MRDWRVAVVWAAAIGLLCGAMACGNEESPLSDPFVPTAIVTEIALPTEVGSPGGTPLSIADQIPPTATPTPVVPMSEYEAFQAAITEEYLARCRTFVRNRENAATYADFLALDPNNMTDLERVIWAEEIGRNEYCRDYWSEPLSARNADKRNESYRNNCYKNLWERHREFERRRGDSGYALRFDQAARIANWVEIPGDVLLVMTVKPVDLAPPVIELERRGEEVDDEWVGLSRVWPGNEYEVGPNPTSSSSYSACSRYYPQLFTGYWIPLDTATTRQTIEEQLARATPTPMPDEMRIWINRRDRPVYVGE